MWTNSWWRFTVRRWLISANRHQTKVAFFSGKIAIIKIEFVILNIYGAASRMAWLPLGLNLLALLKMCSTERMPARGINEYPPDSPVGSPVELLIQRIASIPVCIQAAANEMHSNWFQENWSESLIIVRFEARFSRAYGNSFWIAL